jgi:hypothetical protein
MLGNKADVRRLAYRAMEQARYSSRILEREPGIEAVT